MLISHHFISPSFLNHSMCGFLFYSAQSCCPALFNLSKHINVIFITWFVTICANVCLVFRPTECFNLNVAIVTQWTAFVCSLSTDVNVLGQWMLPLWSYSLLKCWRWFRIFHLFAIKKVYPFSFTSSVKIFHKTRRTYYNYRTLSVHGTFVCSGFSLLLVFSASNQEKGS